MRIFFSFLEPFLDQQDRFRFFGYIAFKSTKVAKAFSLSKTGILQPPAATTAEHGLTDHRE